MNLRENSKMMSLFTCITCGVTFKNTDIQRQHYKTDWHRYNLKRKVAELPPVTAEDFEQRVLKQRYLDKMNSGYNEVFCGVCKKNFLCSKSFENHMNSKKHKQNMVNKSNNKSKIVKKLKEVTIEKKEKDLLESDVESDSEVEEVSSDEWNEEDPENPINNDNCLFCNHHSINFSENLKHMSEFHSFFLPDLEYCVDLKGLLLHLGAKVFHERICLWCNRNNFQSVQAVQKHMVSVFKIIFLQKFFTYFALIGTISDKY